jgi:multidrug resistance efflux pump
MRAFVILGVILLIGTVIGAKLVMDQSAASGKSGNSNDPNQLPDRIVCWGYFDVEPGVLGLHPKQVGDVVTVATENTHYKKGDVLLQLNDKLADLKVKEANADVTAGERQLEEARLLPKLYKNQADEQQRAINAVDKEVEKTKLDRDIKLSGFSDDSKLKKNSEEFYRVALEMLAEKKAAEELKLKRIGLQNAQLKIDQAQADLDAKKLRLEQAKEALNHFKVIAPYDGAVLRANTRAFEVLGPNPRAHAIEFKPDGDIVVRAEVMQEWARHVKKDAEVAIEDDTFRGPKWKGKVKSVSEWFAPTRSIVIEPFRLNDVRTLECIITIEKTESTMRVGQRVRAMIKMGK